MEMTMAYFIRNGNDYSVSENAAIDISETLPPGNYTVGIDRFENFFLSCMEPFKPMSKVYGDSTKNAGRILNTYKVRDVSTGVLLTGEKGSGKTMLAKNIAIAAYDEGMPCIVINAPYHGDKFSKFIQNISQPCIIFFDEFEKIYNSEKQQYILTLLDGVFTSKKLFLLTCNDKWRIDNHMRNRPGRLFYMIDFGGLEPEFIREYCNDVLENKGHIDQICKLSTMFATFNFDMLKALVEEMNRYDESPAEAFKLINAKPENSDHMSYDIELLVNGVKKESSKFDDGPTWNGNPLSCAVHIQYQENDETDLEYYNFTNMDIHKVDSSIGSFEYRVGDRVLKLTRRKTPKFDIFGVI